MKNTRKIIVALLVLVTMLMSMTAIVASAADEAAPQIGDFWASDSSYTVSGKDPVNIKFSGNGATYTCVGADISGLAAGNDTFTVTVTNNGAASARVRLDIQGTTQVGNHTVCNVSATGAEGIWTDTEWGGSHFDLAAGATVTVVITYDGNTERGAVTNLVVFLDSCKADSAAYNSDVTLSNLTFSNSKAQSETPKTHVLESKDFETFKSTEDNHRVVMNDYFTVIFKKDGKVDDADEVTFSDGYTATRRINFGGKINVNNGVVNKSAIEITTTGPVDVKVWWVCGSSSGDRYIGIITTDKTEHAATAKGEAGTAYIDTLTLEEAGTYYVGPLGNGSYIYKVEVSPKAETPACEHDWLAATCVAPKTCKLCGATEGEANPDAHYYYYNICALCYGPNPHFVANNVVAGENKLVVNEYHLVANGEGEHGHPYEFPYFTVTEAGRYTFTCDKQLSVFVYTTPVTAENADIWASGGTGWNVFDYDGEVDLQPGLYFVGFIYLEDQGEYNLTITKSEIPAPHEHNFVEGKCECGESDPNYVPPHEHTFVEGKCECGESDPNYVPPHEHTFVEGKCECGESDPNYVAPTIFEIILKYITDFFAKIANFFKGLFA